MKPATLLAIGLLSFLPFDAPPLASASANHPPHPQVLPGWHAVPFSDFTLEAGTFCPFTLQGDILRNDAIGTVPKTLPDGTPEREVFMGPQRIRMSNADSGQSVITFLDGILIYDYAGDGSFTLTALGKNIIGFLPGDSFPTGLYFLDGYHVIHYTPKAAPGQYTRQMVSAIGIETSYCRTLARD